MKFLIQLAALSLLLYGSVGAQVKPCCKALVLTAELRGYGSAEAQLPFWLRANQYGIAPETSLQSPAYGLQSRLGARIGYSKPLHAKGLDWGAGIEAVSNLMTHPQEVTTRSGGKTTSNTRILLPEYYLKAKWRHFELMAGRRRQVHGLVGDSSLTSGSYIWSGNAMPLPRVQVSIPDYWSWGFLKHLVSVKGLYAFGWFGDEPNAFVQNYYLHQSALYFRLGKPNWKIRLYGGFNHQVQWGGYAQALKNDAGGISDHGHFATGWTPYYRVVLGISTKDNYKYNALDGGNRIGNHLGTIDAGAEIKFKTSRLIFYRQSIYDDGSLYFLINISDGLNGVSWQNQKHHKGFHIKALTAEMFSSTSQGGPVFSQNDANLRGTDNYFNHTQYQEGWS